MPAAWEMQPGESAVAFEAFALYRDWGQERSLARVAEKLGKSETLMSRWSAQHGWVRRAEAWEAHLDAEKVKRLKAGVGEMAERHAKVAMLFQQKVIERLRELKPGELSPAELSRWYDVAVKVERLSRGEATERKGEDEGAGFDLSKLSDDELAALAQAVQKSKAE